MYYQVRVAIVGDFSNYTSKSLSDFINESNKRKQIIFGSSTAETPTSTTFPLTPLTIRLNNNYSKKDFFSNFITKILVKHIKIINLRSLTN
ncbi:MAG: hypothetical protein CVU13_11500 [Bacteroidetes bacterium HGW-Bacteroidetes-8]|nr:MAG: hypothetical protein CVU13_11500 [Bacteroidetes bacterium HGW-Bacteroidetes-8]